jgi:hypothetical protein
MLPYELFIKFLYRRKLHILSDDIQYTEVFSTRTGTGIEIPNKKLKWGFALRIKMHLDTSRQICDAGQAEQSP